MNTLLEEFIVLFQNQGEYLWLHHDHKVREEGVKALKLQGGHFRDSRNFVRIQQNTRIS
jgi:hypothetical protein